MSPNPFELSKASPVEVSRILHSRNYEYWNDRKNSFVANGLSTESVAPILVDSAIQKLDGLDGLVLVHPDFRSLEDKLMYKDVIQTVVSRCINSGKHVFRLMFNDDASGFDPGIWRGTIPYHTVTADNNYGYDKDTLQQEVDFVSETLGKPADQIALAWGGMIEGLCVVQWRDHRCLAVKPETSKFFWADRHKELPARPFSYGEILPELVVTHE